MMGVGVGMIGIATHHPVLATVGLLGGLYHLLNHAVFKGLLFLGAGSVMYRLHTKDMDLMGGRQTYALHRILFLNRYHGDFCIATV